MKPESNAARWVYPAEDLEIQGRTLRVDLMYVGTSPEGAARASRIDPGVFDCALPVGWEYPAPKGCGLGPWPSLGGMSPEPRATWWAWNAGERRDAGVHPDYVKLFLCGLERRLLVDLPRAEDALCECEPIFTELERLAAVYGGAPRIRAITGGLLDAARLLHDRRPAYEFAPPTWGSDDRLRPIVAAAISESAAAGLPLPAEWAHAWAVCDPSIALPGAVATCPSEFRALFVRGYEEGFGAGLEIDPRLPRVALAYHPVNPSLPWETPTGRSVIPDSELRPILDRLTPLLRRCASELRPYARWRRRHPLDEVSPRGLVLLPRVLLVQHPTAVGLRSWLASRMDGTGMAVIDAVELLGRVQGGQVGAPGLAESIAVGDLLAALGIGIEPDPRRDASCLRCGRKVVLFALPAGSSPEVSVACRRAARILDGAANVLHSDGPVGGSLNDTLLRLPDALAELRVEERLRVKAHALWASLGGPIGFRPSTTTAIGDPTEHQAIIRATARIACGLVRPTAQQMSSVRRMYVHAGLPPRLASDDRHEVECLLSREDGPSLDEAIAAWMREGCGLPGLRRDGCDALDRDRVARVSAESDRAEARLAPILLDEGEPPRPTPPNTQPSLENPALTAFLRDLSARAEWPQEEFNALARRHDLLPNAAFEAINEMGLSVCGEPVCEGTNPVVVDFRVIMEVLR